MRKMKNLLFGVMLTAAVYGVWQMWPTVSEFITVPPEKTTIDVKWHRWEKNNTTILSIDETKGQQIVEHLDKIRKRWAPKDSPDAQIRLTIVDNKQRMFELFGLEQSHVEHRNGEVIIWFLWDEAGDLGL